MLKHALALVVFACLTACEPINHWIGIEDDGIVEEVSEEIIYYKTGAKFDLTPSSPE